MDQTITACIKVFTGTGSDKTRKMVYILMKGLRICENSEWNENFYTTLLNDLDSRDKEYKPLCFIRKYTMDFLIMTIKPCSKHLQSKYIIMTRRKQNNLIDYNTLTNHLKTIYRPDHNFLSKILFHFLSFPQHLKDSCYMFKILGNFAKTTFTLYLKRL